MSSLRRLSAIFLLSLTLVALELVWTRLFSAEFYYPFAFLALSLLRDRPEEKGLLPVGSGDAPARGRSGEAGTEGNIYRKGIIYYLGGIYFLFGFTYVIAATFMVTALVRYWWLHR